MVTERVYVQERGPIPSKSTGSEAIGLLLNVRVMIVVDPSTATQAFLEAVKAIATVTQDSDRL